jgi:hypothetical protein
MAAPKADWMAAMKAARWVYQMAATRADQRVDQTAAH